MFCVASPTAMHNVAPATTLVPSTACTEILALSKFSRTAIPAHLPRPGAGQHTANPDRRADIKIIWPPAAVPDIALVTISHNFAGKNTNPASRGTYQATKKLQADGIRRIEQYKDNK